MSAPIPVHVLHYKANSERRRYLEGALPAGQFDVNWITEFDAGEFDLTSVYAFDESLHRSMIDPIKEIMVAYIIGRDIMPHVPWASCLDMLRRERLDLDQLEEMAPWLKPARRSVPEVSLFLKHRLAWDCLANGNSEWAIVAEDDIVLRPDSMDYLADLLATLPPGFDYIDLVGGCNLLPRIGNPVVNRYFFEIQPARDRTTCCALMTRAFAKRLVDASPPICLPVDWTLTWAFRLLSAKVYWLDPPVFGHGSEMQVYSSSIR